MNVEIVDINDVKLNKKNPRIIQDERFNKLVKSIQDFPEMLNIRPIVVDSEMIVLGGNMRLKASRKAGLKSVPIIKVDNLTDQQKDEFIIKDNSNYGDWDWELLQTEWDVELLSDWGVGENINWGNSEMLEMVNSGDENSEWVGMPEFNVAEKTPQLIIRFENINSMDEWCKMKNITPYVKKGLCWNYKWPENNINRDDTSSLKIK